MMRTMMICTIGLIFGTAANAAVVEESYTDARGARVLQQSIVVSATPAQVWDAFTTDGGFMKWAAPVAHIVGGNGGSIEFSPVPAGHIGDAVTVRHRIDLYLPERMLIFHNEVLPPGAPFDASAFQSVRIVLTFAQTGERTTKVTEAVVGFGKGAAYDGLYQHLHEGNAGYLTTLAALFKE